MNNINDINISKYASQAPAEPNNDIYVIISILIFGSVLIFVVKMVYTFIKAYKEGDAELKNEEKVKESLIKGSIKSIKPSNKKICVYCGKQNDIESKFCNNCGKRMP